MRNVRVVKLCIVFSFCLAVCHAKGNRTDSLKNILQQHKIHDSSYVDLVLDFSEAIEDQDLKSAILLAQEGIETAEKLNWNKGIIRGSLILGWHMEGEAIFDKALALYISALSMAEKDNNKKFTAQANVVLGNFYGVMSEDSLSAYHSTKGLNEATILKNEKLMMKAMCNLGWHHLGDNKIDTAFEYLDKAFTIAIAQNDEKELAKIYVARGNGLRKQSKFTEAIDDIKRALALWEKTKSYGWSATTMCYLSRVYSEIPNRDSASWYAYSALQFVNEKNLNREKLYAYGALFNVHYKFGDYKKALEFRIISDSLRFKQHNNFVAQNSERTRLKYEQDKKDALAQKELLIKENETKKIRNIQFTAIAFFVLLAGFLFWNYRQSQKSKLKIEKAYTELKSTQKQLIQAEKMASLGELTAGIAHEIQNPLNFVNNFSEVSTELIEELKEELAEGNTEDVIELADMLTQNLEKINHHGGRASGIVKGMLAHSRTGSATQKELTDLNALCDEYLMLAYHGLRAKDKSFNAAYETNFDANLPKLEIVPQDIGRVILNLINNAFYVVNEKGKEGISGYEPKVVVSTKFHPPTPASGGDSTIEILVKDNGKGIPKNIIDKIFQPFFTTKPTGQGTGLGLSLSYDIVKAHGGEISVDSESGKGTTFHILLPMP